MKNDPTYFILMQKNYQDEKMITQTEEQYLQERITKYEEEVGRTYEKLYGHFTTYGELDLMDDGLYLVIWKGLIEELQGIRSKTGE